EQIIKQYELDTKKEVFTNHYESEYLGTITYKEYNLKR
ncbi:Rep protein, partial [Oceanobacillus bengalensis]